MASLSPHVSAAHVVLAVACLFPFSTEENRIRDRQGPVFIYEPPNTVEFLNEKGATIDCSAHGQPEPKVRWTTKTGLNVKDVPNLRSIRSNGSIVFAPFDSKQYRQDVHAAVYICSVSNRNGRIVSRPVYVRAVVNHAYEVQVYNEFVIVGNTAVLRCHIPSYVSGYVSVISWFRSDNYIIRPQSKKHIGGRYSVFEDGQLHVRNVMASDGHWSFWCQTRHRLSGETVRSSTSGKLVVTEPRSSVPPQINDRKSTLKVQEGNTAELPCAAQSFPVPRYRWSKFDEAKEEYVQVKLSRRIMQLSGSLFIQSAKPSDSGQYKCRITNSVGSQSFTTLFAVNAPLVVYIEPQNEVVSYGQSANLNCTHSIQSEDTLITWLHNGEVITTGSYFRVRRIGRHSLLSITRVHTEHQGMYQCLVKNGEHKQSQGTAQILLADTLPELKPKFPRRVIQKGSTASISCKAIGSPLPSISWYRDGQLLSRRFNTLIKSQILDAEEIVSAVNISNMQVQDGGLFKCVAKNSAGEVFHRERVNVFGEPQIRAMDNVTVVSGRNHSLNCYVSGYPLPSIHWQKDGDVLKLNSRHTDYENGTLFVRNVVKETDQGRYTCVSRSSDGHALQTMHTYVNVQTEPVVVINHMASFKPNDRGVLTCVVTKGDQPVTKTWLKDNSTIPSHLEISINNMAGFSALVIPKLQPRHNGLYTCVARNEAGVSNASVPLHVHTPPMWIVRPSNVTAKNGQDVIFHCEATGFPIPRIIWKRIIGGREEDVAIFRSKKMKLLANASLVIKNVTLNDIGLYRCLVKNGIGLDLVHTVELNIGGIPLIKARTSGKLALVGSKARLTCVVETNHSATLAWTKDSSISMDGSRMKQWTKDFDESIVSFMEIEAVGLVDSGQYFCHASGRYGQSKDNISLTVLGVQNSSFDVEVGHWNSSFFLIKWKDSSKDGKLLLSHIIIKSMSGDVIQNFSVDTGGKRKVVLPNLPQGLSYLVQMHSQDLADISDHSIASDFSLSNNNTFIVNSVKAANSVAQISSKSIYMAVYATCGICLLLVVLIVSLYVIKRHLHSKTAKRRPALNDAQGDRGGVVKLSKDTRSQSEHQQITPNKDRKQVYSLPTSSDNYYDDISPYATFQLPDCRMLSSSQQVHLKTFSNSN